MNVISSRKHPDNQDQPATRRLGVTCRPCEFPQETGTPAVFRWR